MDAIVTEPSARSPATCSRPRGQRLPRPGEAVGRSRKGLRRLRCPRSPARALAHPGAVEASGRRSRGRRRREPCSVAHVVAKVRAASSFKTAGGSRRNPGLCRDAVPRVLVAAADRACVTSAGTSAGTAIAMGRHVAPLGHRRQPLHPRPARQPHQEGLGHVVLRVGHQHMRDARRATGRSAPGARAVPRPEGCPARPSAIEAWHVWMPSAAHSAATIAASAARSRASARGPPSRPMQPHAHLPRPFVAQPQHRHGIAAARDGQRDIGRKLRPQKLPPSAPRNGRSDCFRSRTAEVEPFRLRRRHGRIARDSALPTS
jgi:hypothetical protein